MSYQEVDFLDLRNIKALDFYRNELGRKRAVIIDDDPNHNNLLLRHITRSDYNDKLGLSVFQDEREAVMSLDTEEVDLFIIDVELSHLSGFEVGNVIRGFSTFNAPIIYISASEKYYSDFCRNRLKNSYFLPKPFSKGEFLSVIYTVCDF